MQTSKFRRFLLIGDSTDEYGLQVLVKTLRSMGSLETAMEGEIADKLHARFYDIVIVDAGVVDTVAPVVARVCAQSPDSKVVVITASPHWKVARDVFRAGAADYLHKAQPRKEIRASLHNLLAQQGAGTRQMAEGGAEL